MLAPNIFNPLAFPRARESFFFFVAHYTVMDSSNIESKLFWTGHAGFYVKASGMTVFIDPFKLPRSLDERADLVLVTHPHFDHCSKPDIDRVVKDGTRIIAAQGCLDEHDYNGVTVAKPGFAEKVGDATINAVPAYNVKPERLKSHPKENAWLGYVVEIGGVRIYHAGDTDLIPEMQYLKSIDAALLPVGGTYTMDLDEALEANKVIAPTFFVPMHYRNLLGEGGSAAVEEKLRASADNVLLLKEPEPTYEFPSRP